MPSQPDSLYRLFVGYIIASFPQYGAALIAMDQGQMELKRQLVGYVPYTQADYGVAVLNHLQQGQSVLCMQHPTDQSFALILCPCNLQNANIQDWAMARAFYDMQDFTTNDMSSYDSLLESSLGNIRAMFRGHQGNADLDALPGDYDIVDARGRNGLHIGRLVTQLKGGPLSFIDLSELTNTIRVVADKYQQHTLTGIQYATANYRVQNTATSLSQAFGTLVPESPGVKRTKLSEQEDSIGVFGRMELQEQNAIPFYRIQHAQGAAVDGEQHVILGSEQTEHSTSCQPHILAMTKKGLSGQLTQASTLGLHSIKTPAIIGIQQLGYGVEGLTDLLQPYEQTDKKDPEWPGTDSQDKWIDDAVLNKIIDKLLTGDYFARLKKLLAENGFAISSQNSTLQANEFKDSKQPSGLTDKQEYQLPDSVVIIDPVTGRPHRYYASTSFISQQDDGSILLCDGYGSQIRMSRGNIYISPALDLIFRPGRDLSSMVPRHQSFNAQGTCTINSTGSMYVRAQSDLKIAGATSGNGIVVLQSDATSNDTKQGLLIRSNTNTAMTGNDIYIGRNTNQNLNKQKVTPPATNGSIVIDACNNGVITQTGKQNTILADNCVIGSVVQNSSLNTAVAVSQSMIGLYAPNIIAPANLEMRTLEKAATINVCKDGKTEAVSLKTAGTPGLAVSGQAIIGGNMVCNGQGRFNDGVAAKGVISTNQVNNVTRQPNRVFAKQQIPTIRPEGLDTGAQQVVQASKTAYQDIYTAQNKFAFPVSYSVPKQTRMPGMLWQQMTKQKDNPDQQQKWKQVYVKNAQGVDTACYPGVEVWQSATLSVPGYKEVSLKSEYVMNAKRSEQK